ncbi:hypothetical protein BWQ96_10341 [Gracilariopsis chorda]|uniref:Uncharacterized protein n=1 Tax=Gracilariopsis chorda TaxID=448386 RepID=A0A2V3ICY6_9FLOR|nr:hypothetical protein BWQ96_10341 [Gracilariopsis chorda]|eukprot:PXF39949.1 hypothetical protein BWQ96_10341 [Gracilariopsis chorda]
MLSKAAIESKLEVLDWTSSFLNPNQSNLDRKRAGSNPMDSMFTRSGNGGNVIAFKESRESFPPEECKPPRFTCKFFSLFIPHCLARSNMLSAFRLIYKVPDSCKFPHSGQVVLFQCIPGKVASLKRKRNEFMFSLSLDQPLNLWSGAMKLKSNDTT